MKICECGCGQEVGEGKRFVWGHNCRGKKLKQSTKDKIARAKLGELNPNWKGGKIESIGYIYILTPNHPSYSPGSYVPEHRLIMEKHLKRYLIDKEVVHHINGIGTDNRLENLQLMFLSEHISLHHSGKVISEEWRKNHSKLMKGRFVGENNPNYGKTHSEETKNKMSIAHKGIKHSEEHKRKIGESLKNAARRKTNDKQY
jgi:hypothetical protein